MGSVEQSIVVGEPLRTVYDQCTQFEQFPRFMEGVRRVERLDATHLRWVSEVGGRQREWEAEITDQTPDSRIAWRSVSGFRNDGTLTFRPEGEGTRVSFRMDFDPDASQRPGGAEPGAAESRVMGDLERLKAFMEHHGR